jgi:hypothetical protein
MAQGRWFAFTLHYPPTKLLLRQCSAQVLPPTPSLHHFPLAWKQQDSVLLKLEAGGTVLCHTGLCFNAFLLSRV